MATYQTMLLDLLNMGNDARAVSPAKHADQERPRSLMQELLEGSEPLVGPHDIWTPIGTAPELVLAEGTTSDGVYLVPADLFDEDEELDEPFVTSSDTSNPKVIYTPTTSDSALFLAAGHSFDNEFVPGAQAFYTLTHTAGWAESDQSSPLPAPRPLRVASALPGPPGWLIQDETSEQGLNDSSSTREGTAKDLLARELTWIAATADRAVADSGAALAQCDAAELHEARGQLIRLTRQFLDGCMARQAELLGQRRTGSKLSANAAPFKPSSKLSAEATTFVPGFGPSSGLSARAPAFVPAQARIRQAVRALPFVPGARFRSALSVRAQEFRPGCQCRTRDWVMDMEG